MTQLLQKPKYTEPASAYNNSAQFKLEEPVALPPLPRRTLRFSERKLLLALLDTTTLNLGLLITLTLQSVSILTPEELWKRLPWFMTLSALWLSIGLIMNVYNLARAANIIGSLVVTSGTVITTAIIYIFTPFITPAFHHRREALIFVILSVLLVSLWRITYAKVLVTPDFCQRVLVVGAGQSGRNLAQAIAHTTGRGTLYQVLGFIDDDAAKLGQDFEGVRVIGSSQGLTTLARQLQPDEIILAITYSQSLNKELCEAILACREFGMNITTMSAVYERLTGRIPLNHIGRDLHIAVAVRQTATNRLYLAVRRLVDVLVGLVGAVLLVALIPFIWIANRICSPGPLFYRQERVGKAGKLFSIIKFRSMVVNAEAGTGAVWANAKDKRITHFGHFLRKTRLDEVPQFWNILKGDMSLIGPRPERPYFVERFVQDVPFYRARHAAKPGLTGWAQVKHGYTACIEDSLVKLQYDLYYIKHQCFLLDLLIVFKTVAVVLGFKGR